MSAKEKLKNNFFKKFQNLLDPKYLFFFSISTLKCIELNSEFVRPKNNLGFGFGFGFGSRPKTQYIQFQVIPSFFKFRA
jgi:hypothetical protein